MIDLVSVRPLTPHDPDWRTFSDLLALAALPRPEGSGRSFAIEDERGLLGFGAMEGDGRIGSSGRSCWSRAFVVAA